jgi:hypothetical protein
MKIKKLKPKEVAQEDDKSYKRGYKNKDWHNKEDTPYRGSNFQHERRGRGRGRGRGDGRGRGRARQ